VLYQLSYARISSTAFHADPLPLFDATDDNSL
jgi:hypothetical protein